MVNTRGVRSSIDGNAPLDPQEDDNGDQKVPHPLDDEDALSPRASKKRRTGSATEDRPEADQVPGNQIEEELASAVDPGVDDQDDPMDDSQDQIRNEGPGGSGSTAELDPDMATVISNIMNHAERVEEQYFLGQQQLAESNDQSGQRGMVFVKANSHLKIQSLPILDNLSTQILSLLAKSSYQDITAFVAEPDSENGQAYATMRSLFDHTKKVYSTKYSFLSPTDLELTEPAQVDVIRKANMASFVSSIFGTQEIGFAELNDNFIDVFVPEGGRLLKVQGALLLELKTQAFIAALNTTERTRTELLFELFPDNLEQQMLDRRPGTRQLAPSEVDFLKRAKSRRDIILNDINNEEALMSLPDKYHWEDFLRDLSSYVTKNFDAISHPQTKRAIKGRQSSSSNGDVQESSGASLQGQFSVAPPAPEVPVDKNMHGDLVARAARAAQIALQGHGLRRSQPQQQPASQPPALPVPQSSQQAPQANQAPPQQPHQTQTPQQGSHWLPPPAPIDPPHQPHHHSPPPPKFPQQQITFQQSPLQANFHQYSPGPPAPSQGKSDAMAANHGYMPGIPHYSQSQPTQVLYERARMAASAKSSPSTRKSGLPSQRRPWTTEEENALMAGLDRVKGPHWSQILAMFGPGGTISEALKDRNQVQLKDKARNLKLFFLKSGIEVPYYLKFVTGELKTRAPAQAAKREARERQKKQGEEDKAHVEGIKGMMALAGAHSQPVPMTPGHEGMSASPSLPPDTGSQAGLDQTAEQNLIQTLGPEVHGERFGQTQQTPEANGHGQ